MAAPDRKPLVVFVHIRKTAGKTLRNLLYREYGRDNTQLVKSYFSRGERSRVSVGRLAADPGHVRVLHGHMLFWPELDWPAGTQFFTMLRDPVERTLSHYFWTKARKPPDWPKTLEEAIDDGSIRENFQTRTIADAMTDPTPLGRAVLERAIDRLYRFDVVGVTDRFDESLALMTQTLGWTWRLYRRDNVTRARKARDEIAPETIRRIEELNAFDRELYLAARARLESDLAAQDDRFRIELDAMTRASALAAAGDPSGLLDTHVDPVGDGEHDRLVAARAEELLRAANADWIASTTPPTSTLRQRAAASRRRFAAIVQR